MAYVFPLIQDTFMGVFLHSIFKRGLISICETVIYQEYFEMLEGKLISKQRKGKLNNNTSKKKKKSEQIIEWKTKGEETKG